MFGFRMLIFITSSITIFNEVSLYPPLELILMLIADWKTELQLARTMFLHCPVILLALVFSVSISEVHVSAKPGPGSSDVCHSAQAYSNSLDSLMGLCDGVSSVASGTRARTLQFRYSISVISFPKPIFLDQCTVPTVEILKPCVHGGLVDSSCFRNSILPV